MGKRMLCFASCSHLRAGPLHAKGSTTAGRKPIPFLMRSKMMAWPGIGGDESWLVCASDGYINAAEAKGCMEANAKWSNA
eukprot:263583-Ditylum_brightwellii.AAC.1